MAYPAGEYAGTDLKKDEDKLEEVMREIDLEGFDFPEEGELPQDKVDKLFQKTLQLIAEDYPNPENLLNEWKDQSFGDPNIEDPRYQYKENYNVEIILDASGSMAADAGNGKTRMDVAKQSIKDFTASLPEGAKVGLRVYGHKGSSSDADMQLSCESNELIYDVQTYDERKLDASLSELKASGWTPLAKAIELANEDLKEFNGESNTNIIYVVSDGIETCGGDPVEAASNLKDSNSTPIVNVIGLDVDSEGQAQLKEVAEAADGSYALVKDQNDLQEQFQRSTEIANKWRQWKVDAINDNAKNWTDRSNQIMNYHSDWVEIQNNYNSNMSAIQNKFAEQLDYEQVDQFDELAQEYLQFLSDTRETTGKELSRVNEEKVNSGSEEINEKYDKAQ